MHGFADNDVTVESTDHVIAVHLGGTAHVRQTRAGRTVSRPMGAGDIAISPIGPPIRWQQSGHSLVVLLRVAPGCIDAAAGDECATHADRFEIRGRLGARDDVIESIARGMLRAMELEGADSRLLADTLTCELAIHLLRAYTTSAREPTWRSARLPPHKLRRAIAYIDDHLHGELTLAAMAQAVALSPGHFAHAFRDATGIAPHRYIVERRVEHAKALLRDSDLPITEIAHRVGCASNSHFSVLFHRVTGVTPRQFRNRC
jgi:AraC family transcriptional regulator